MRQQPQGRSNFKFFNMWTEHEKFLQIVADHWCRVINGSPMFILCAKLRSLKRPLRILNQQHFGHISERVAKASAELEQIQLVRQLDCDNERLQDQEKDLRLKLANVKAAERMFFSQKLKYKFLEESDRGSKFFHSLMNQNTGEILLQQFKMGMASSLLPWTRLGLFLWIILKICWGLQRSPLLWIAPSFLRALA